MSRKAMLSLWGLYTYNTDLFDGLQVPTDPDEAELFDKQDLIDNILLELAELEVLYTDPDFMQQAITAWTKKNFPVWQELANTLFYEYDPIENYNRVEHWVDDLAAGQTHTTTYTPTTKDTTKFTPGVTDTNTNSVTGFNDTQWADKEKNVLGHTGFDTSELSHTGYDTTAVVGSGKDTNTRDGYAKGNIGVTTTQQMIEAQREVVKFNVMDYIIDDFKGRFCILVY